MEKWYKVFCMKCHRGVLLEVLGKERLEQAQKQQIGARKVCPKCDYINYI